MMHGRHLFSRRDFLKLGILSSGSLAFDLSRRDIWRAMMGEQQGAERLGRLCAVCDLHMKPSNDSPVIEKLEKDTVVVWLREVLGDSPPYLLGHTWVETPAGYLYAPDVQPVYDVLNQPLHELPETEKLGRGMWAEVTVPLVPIVLEHESSARWITTSTHPPRLYYSQVLWIDDVRENEAGTWEYRVFEKYGRDVFWADAESFRPLTTEELDPIHPQAEEKKVVVDLNHQVMSCFEGEDEVYFCRISSGTRFDPDENGKVKWATPLGPHPIWRKLISHHMSGGDLETGYDLPGIAWTSLFSGDGVAIHATYWHNDYGTPLSHGCINARPEDAKWVFRWTQPHIPYEVGDLIVQMPGGTTVDVVAG